MKIHEFQAKTLLQKAGVAVPRGLVVKTADDAAKAFESLGGEIAVVKSQIHAGGRGKGRFKEHPDQPGVVLVRSAEEARANAARMLNSTLVTIQTGEEGKVVHTLFVEEGLNIERELYLAVVVDRETGGPVAIMSSEGGMEIEEVAKETPEKIFQESIHTGYGLHGFQARRLAYRLGLDGQAVRSAEAFLPKFCKFFIDNDCSMAEINPSCRHRRSGELLALDAKVTFRRQRAVIVIQRFLADLSATFHEEEPTEIQARQECGTQLRKTRWQHRLPGERSRSGNEHDGYHQIPRR